MADTKKYLYYGDLLVDELALLTDLADGFASDVNKLSVSNKVKLHILSAGNDIILSGIKGAKPNGTSWEIETGGTPLPLNLETSKYYGYAANLIQKRMKRLATTPVKEEDTETEFPEFTSTQLLLSLRIARSSFGGLGFTTTLWRDLFEDPRDKETGLFGNSKRKAELANLLELLKNDLTSNPYNFEGSAFTDVNDYLKRLDVAINALRNNEISEQDLKKSLFSIGLDYDDWFNNGSGDTYVDENGYYHIDEATLKPYTYGSWYNYLNQLNTLKQEAEQKAAEEKLKALDALQVYTSKPVLKALSLTDLSNKYNGDLNAAISNFSKVNLSQLTQELNDELVSLFLGGYNSNALDDISDDEWELIKTKVATNGEDRSLYRKIEGINGIYYDVAKKHLFQLGNFLQTNNKNFLSGLSDKEKKDAELLRLIFEGSGLSGADIADIAATFTDLAGIGASFIPVVGNVAGAATGAAGSLTHFGADWSRDGLDWGDVGRLGVNLAFDAATLIPGFGTAAKAGKIARFLAPKVPYIIAGIGAVLGLSNGTEIVNSFKKLSNPSTVTVEDLQNMAQGIALLAGGVNVSKGIYLSRQAKKNLKPATSSESATIKTRNGRTLELNESEYNTLNSKTATREAKQAAVESAATRSGTPLDTTDGISYKGRSLTNPTRTKNTSTEVEGLTAPKEATLGANIREVRERNKKWIEEHPILSRILPGRTTDSKINWTNDGMYIRGFKEDNTTNNTTNNSSTGEKVSTNDLVPEKFDAKDPKINPEFYHNPATKNPNPPKISEIREGMLLWKNNNKGLFSTNKLTSGEYTINGSRIQVIEQTDGTFNILFKGEHIGNYRNLKDLQKQIFNIIKKLRRPDLSKPAEISPKEIAKVLKDLKKKGWLKHGGKIIDTQIDTFLKQYRI